MASPEPEELEQQPQPSRGGTLYVSNLAYEMSQARLQHLIEDKAEVSVVRLELIKRGKPERLQNAGMAIVTLEQGTDIAKCINKLQQVVQDGRPLAVSTERFL